MQHEERRRKVDASPLAVPATFFAKAEDGGAPMADLRRTTMGSVGSSSSLSLISPTHSKTNSTRIFSNEQEIIHKKNNEKARR
jgi:hypothetical protein